MANPVQRSLLFLCLTASLWAQGTTSRVVGTVQDSSGSAVAAAAVRLSSDATGVTFTTTTSSAGTYTFEAIQSGSYSLSVESAGFKKFATSGVRVTIGQPATVNVKLEVGAVTEVMNVSGAAEVVQTSSSANIGNVIVEKTIRDLPIVGTRGRNPLGLIDLQPGVVDTQNITGGAVAVFGARDRAINITLDGIDSNETVLSNAG